MVVFFLFLMFADSTLGAAVGRVPGGVPADVPQERSIKRVSVQIVDSGYALALNL